MRIEDQKEELKSESVSLSIAISEFQNTIQKLTDLSQPTQRQETEKALSASLLADATKSHDALLRAFNQNKNYKRLESTLKNGSLAVKVIGCDFKFHFIDDSLKDYSQQIITPQTVRPFKTLNKSLPIDRSIVFRPDTGEIEERKVSETRGAKKDTPFSKAMCFTACLNLSETKTYYRYLSHNDGAIILAIDLDYCFLKPYNIFPANMATDDRWNIKGTERWDEVLKSKDKFRSTTLEEIRKSQRNHLEKKELCPQNEIRPAVSTAAVVGIIAYTRTKSLGHYDYPYTTTKLEDRLKGLIANYFFRQEAHKAYPEYPELWRNFPTYILLPHSETLQEYTIDMQINDLRDIYIKSDMVLSWHDKSYDYDAAEEYQLFFKNFRKFITDKEIYSPAVNLFFNKISDSDEEKKSAHDAKNIFAVCQEGFPLKCLTNRQLILVTNIPEFFSSNNYIYDHEYISFLISQDKHPNFYLPLNESDKSLIDSNIILKLIQLKNFNDDQLVQILSSAIKSRKDLISPIIDLIKDSKGITKLFTDTNLYNMPMDEKIFFSLAKRDYKDFSDINKLNFQTNFLQSKYKIFQNLKTEHLINALNNLIIDPSIDLRTIQYILFRYSHFLNTNILIDFLEIALKKDSINADIFPIFISATLATPMESKLLNSISDYSRISSLLDNIAVIKDNNLIYKLLDDQLNIKINDFLRVIFANLLGDNLEFISQKDLISIFTGFVKYKKIKTQDSEVDELIKLSEKEFNGIFNSESKFLNQTLAQKNLERLLYIFNTREVSKDNRNYVLNRILVSDFTCSEQTQIFNALFTKSSQGQTRTVIVNQIFNEIKDFKNLSRPVLNMINLIQSSDEKDIRNSVEKLLIALINKTDSIDSIMTIVADLEDSKTSKWEFLQTRLSTEPPIECSYRCNAQIVSGAWLKVIQRVQERILELTNELADKNPRMLNKNTSVIEFLQKSTTKNFFGDLFTTNKAKTYCDLCDRSSKLSSTKNFT